MWLREYSEAKAVVARMQASKPARIVRAFAADFASRPRIAFEDWPAATPRGLDEALLTAGPQIDVLHFACHRTFSGEDVMQSGIEPAGIDGKAFLLTAGDLVERQYKP